VASVVRAPKVERRGREEGCRAGEGRSLLTVAAPAARAAAPLTARVGTASVPAVTTLRATSLSAFPHAVTRE
jgi:hypothetical protein